MTVKGGSFYTLQYSTNIYQWLRERACITISDSCVLSAKERDFYEKIIVQKINDEESNECVLLRIIT